MEKKKIDIDDFTLNEILGYNPNQPTTPSNPNVVSESIQPSQLNKESELPETFRLDKTEKKSASAKQRKSDLSEYRGIFLTVPKIIDRKNVFISNSSREMIVGIVRLFGGEKTSVSGFLENLVLHHFEVYLEDFEVWKRLLLSKTNQ